MHKNDSTIALRPVYFLPARHESEQYLTSAQFLAQLLRHVISRPQVTHILLGSDALLPLKPVDEPVDFLSPMGLFCLAVYLTKVSA
jgi:hypothetical protein